MANPFGDFLRALCASDVDTIVEKILEFNVGKTPVDKQAFRAKVKEITDQFKAQQQQAAAGEDKDQADARAKLVRRTTQGAGPHGAKEERYALGDVVGEILLNLQKFKIVLRGDVAASIMTISVSEGLILQLDPEFDMVRSGACCVPACPPARLPACLPVAPCLARGRKVAPPSQS